MQEWFLQFLHDITVIRGKYLRRLFRVLIEDEEIKANYPSMIIGVLSVKL
jgi:hypothetical protein